MKRKHLKSLLSAVFCGFYAFCATAASSIFSDYGQIQNVQNYSTNPFWTPNAPYNQRLPQPVYVQGADLNADDCFKVVQSLVSVQCMARDNCKNTSLAEIRPTIMVQLSNLPGNNYVSACSGFIDGVFESYVAQYGNNVPNRAVSFPNATTPVQNTNNIIQIKNPYKIEPTKQQQEIKERSDELKQLQQQNGANQAHLTATAFPTTFNDLSFSERMALKAEDYEQYKDMQAYVVPNFIGHKEWCEGAGIGSDACKDYEQQQQNSTTTNNNNKPDNNTTDTCANDQQPAHAIKVKKDKNGVCIVEKCESGWKTTADKTACVEIDKNADTYYTLAFCWTPNESEQDYDTYYCAASHLSNNKCYPVCGQPITYNGPINNAIKDLFGSENTYCVPRIMLNSSTVYHHADLDKFSLVDYETQEPLMFEGKRMAKEVAERIFAESDEISDNQGNSKPCDGYSRGHNIDAIILLHDKGSVKIDSIIRIDD